MKANKSILSRLLRFFGNIITTIVSGIPRERITLKPKNKTPLLSKKEDLKSNTEKHYHRPLAKPVVEKQTLLKETKKEKRQLKDNDNRLQLAGKLITVHNQKHNLQ